MKYIVMSPWNDVITVLSDLAAAQKAARQAKGYVVFHRINGRR